MRAVFGLAMLATVILIGCSIVTSSPPTPPSNGGEPAPIPPSRDWRSAVPIGFEMDIRQDCLESFYFFEPSPCDNVGRYLFNWSVIMCGVADLLKSQPTTNVLTDTESYAIWFDNSSVVIRRVAVDVSSIKLPPEGQFATAEALTGFPSFDGIYPELDPKIESDIRPNIVSALNRLADLYSTTASELRLRPGDIDAYREIFTANVKILEDMNDVFSTVTRLQSKYGLSPERYDTICNGPLAGWWSSIEE